MTDGLSLPMSGLVLAMILLGFALGLAYFATLQRSVALLSARRGALVPLALTLLRIAGAVGVLALIARLGALPLLAAFVGFLVARGVMLRAARRSA